MRVLVVAPVFPLRATSGLTIRLRGLLRALVKSHEVTLLCFYREEADLDALTAVNQFCHKIVPVPIQTCSRYQSAPSSRMGTLWHAFFERQPSMVKEWRSTAMEREIEKILSERYDAVWISRLWLTSIMPKISAKTVVDLDDMESVKLRRKLGTMPWKLIRVLGYLETLKLASAERQLVERCSAVVVTSEKDRQALGSDNVFVLPNTVVVPNTVHGVPEKEHDDDLVFFGLMSYSPNADAVEYFSASIWPQIKRARPTARLWIVGANPPPSVSHLHDGTSVIVTGYVDDLAALLAECGVVIAPLRIGGGTRIKILDAMAARKAVVSTSIGCEGLDVRHGEHLLVADSPGEFAQSCLGLMADRERREVLGSAARRLVEERYRWELLPMIVDRILEAVTSR